MFFRLEGPKPIIMKKTLLFTASVVFLACNSTSRYKLTRADSLRIDSEAQSDLASSKLSAMDSIEQDKALGNIMFDISSKEYKVQEKVFLKNKRSDEFKIAHFIGDYEFWNLTPYFSKGKLYKLQLNGRSDSYEEYKTSTQQQFNAIYKTLTEKFRKPDIDNGLIPWYRTEKNYWYTLAEWNIGNKQVSIMMSNEGLNNRIDLLILKKDVQNRLDSLKNAVKDSTAIAAKSDI